MKECTNGKRHSWRFSHNVVKTKLSGHTATVSKRGFYRCACGETKYGSAG